MAGRLTAFPRHRLVLALMLALVLLAHGLLGRAVHELRQGWERVEPMPPRLQVAFVRELAPQAPPAAPPARTAPPPAARRLAPPRPASTPASAAAPAAEDMVRPEPEPEPEPLPASAPASAPLLAAADADADAEAAAAAASAASAPTASDEPSPEWPASTQLSYQLSGNYRGEVSGSAQVQWLRQGRHYQVHLDVLIGPSVAPLIARRMSSDGLLTPAGIAPRRYDEDTKVMFRERRRVSVQFAEREGQTLQLADGRQLPQPAGVQDASSQFVHLTWLFLTGRERMAPGHVVELPLALPRKLYRWRYEVLGEEALATPMGPLTAWHLRPQFLSDSGAASGGELRAEVWLAPSLQYLPVRLRIVQDERTYIDLLLKSAPLQAAP